MKGFTKKRSALVTYSFILYSFYGVLTPSRSHGHHKAFGWRSPLVIQPISSCLCADSTPQDIHKYSSFFPLLSILPSLSLVSATYKNKHPCTYAIGKEIEPARNLQNGHFWIHDRTPPSTDVPASDVCPHSKPLSQIMFGFPKTFRSL